MPYNKDLYDTSFDGQIIDIDDNDKIELRYIYFEVNNNTITKIDSSINKKNIKGAIMSKLIIHRGTQKLAEVQLKLIMAKQSYYSILVCRSIQWLRTNGCRKIINC